MDLASKLDLSYSLFLHNCKCCGIDKILEIKRGDSQIVLPSLFNQFEYDLIYIDGDHSYEAVKSDIMWSRKLLKSNGLLCGDDYELSINEIDPKILMGGIDKKVDVAEATEPGSEFHPGVTLAVGSTLKDVSSTLGVWHVEHKNNNFVEIPELNVEPIIPEELIEFVPASYEWPSLSVHD